MTDIINFIFDDNIKIKVENNEKNFKNNEMLKRIATNNERIFRKIHIYLLKNKIIKGNIIDIGSYIGDNTYPWAKLTNNIIYSIDPSIKNCEYIKEVCELNDIGNVVVLNKLISNTDEVLNCPNSTVEHCSFVWKNGDVGNLNKPEYDLKIKADTFDNLFNNGIINNIGYIHLDVEGMENKILNGSKKVIDVFKPIITFEGHIQVEKEVVKNNVRFLKERNYTIFMINDIITPGQCWGDCRNFIAFPENIDSMELIKKISSNYFLLMD
mgnify:CR=1 FL=1|tara:strand:- start:9882 stop:10685 length:804 start_codon:yes stop_codon:yes gene_type:complete